MADLKFPQINEIQRTGWLYNTPSLKQSERGKPYVRVEMACPKGYGDNQTRETVKVIAYGDFAERIQPLLFSGAPVRIVGAAGCEAYLDKNGEAKAVLVITAYRVDVLAWPADKDSAEKSPQRATRDEDPPREDDIPF